MVKFLIATHGYLADGFKSTLGIIMGEEIANKISTLNCFVEDTPKADDVKMLMHNYFKGLAEGEQVIVFTDILHGSVNQLLIPYADDQKVYILTGINLPLMCEVMTVYGYGEDAVDMERLREFISTAKNETLFVNDFARLKAKENEKNDDSFFE
jgi:fructoselysine/glucoselysine PTS system EIIA component